jgi:hypothetical protein
MSRLTRRLVPQHHSSHPINQSSGLVLVPIDCSVGQGFHSLSFDGMNEEGNL